jgi:ATP phosphoribosyltransferase regulatory subunit
VPLIPAGTRFSLPQEWEWRESLRALIEDLFRSWGYSAVQTPSLEVYDPAHPQAEAAFKLVDRDGSVLALRGEYTTAVSDLVRAAFPDGPWPLRLRYAGNLWMRSSNAEIGRGREYSQVGVELLGVSTPLADAEVLELALEALTRAGLADAAVEIGHPGFVRAVLADTGLEGAALETVRAAVDRKDTPGLAAALAAAGVSGAARDAAIALPDLYGGPEVLDEAGRVASGPPAREALERLRAVAAELPPRRFLYDLGMARRYDYYTGVTFRAYTPDFGLPLVGGGRYDGPPITRPHAVGIPAAGFAIGLERLMAALAGPPPLSPPEAISLDPGLARLMRAKGWRVEAGWTRDLEAVLAYARERGIRYLLADGSVRRVADGQAVEPGEAE